LARRDDPHQPTPRAVGEAACRNEREKRQQRRKSQTGGINGGRVGRQGENELTIRRNLGLEPEPERGVVAMAITELLAADLIQYPSAEREAIYRSLGLLPP
jgi:hypothetical protein